MTIAAYKSSHNHCLLLYRIHHVGYHLSSHRVCCVNITFHCMITIYRQNVMVYYCILLHLYCHMSTVHETYVTGFWKINWNVTLGQLHFIGLANSHANTLPVHCCNTRLSWLVCFSRAYFAEVTTGTMGPMAGTRWQV